MLPLLGSPGQHLNPSSGSAKPGGLTCEGWGVGDLFV